jgi:cyclopropane fatty-acyl-phospholipid synthase-like methyltransferase
LSIFNFKYKNKKVLDIGFNNGENLLELKNRGCEIFGADINKFKIKNIISNKILKPKNTLLYDINELLPKFPKKMDLIISIDTLYYMSNTNFREIFDSYIKNLKVGGYLLVNYINKAFLVKKNFLDFKINNFKEKKTYHHPNNPIFFLNKKKIKELLKSVDLKLVFTSHCFKNVYYKKKKYTYIDLYILFKKI